VTPSLGSETAGPGGQDSSGSERDSGGGTDEIRREPATPCTVLMHSSAGWTQAAADAAIAAYLRAMADGLAERVMRGGLS
jgi:hypothetical protein